MASIEMTQAQYNTIEAVLRRGGAARSADELILRSVAGVLCANALVSDAPATDRMADKAAGDYARVDQVVSTARADVIAKARMLVGAVKSSSIPISSTESQHPLILIDRKIWDDLCRILGAT